MSTIFHRAAGTLVIVMAVAVDVHAYVGPGLGLGVIGTIMGTILTLFLAAVGVVWYPLKRMFKKRRQGPPLSAARGSLAPNTQQSEERGG